jgi:uncharacterized protein (TIGR04255 family)
MKLPRKIYPDNLKDTIIEVRYTSKLPYQAIIGIFYSALIEKYTFTNRPIEKQQVAQLRTLPEIPKEITLTLGSINLFYNENIKIQLQPQSIIFNCFDKYIGWDDYKKEIQFVLDKIISTKSIDTFIRVGVRYITQYQETDLRNCVKFQFTFGMPEIKSNSYSFRTEFVMDEFRIILNLNNNILSLKQRRDIDTTVTPISIIDIDVFQAIPVSDQSDIFSYIEKTHLREKELFFNLLQEDFLNSLKPEY